MDVPHNEVPEGAPSRVEALLLLERALRVLRVATDITALSQAEGLAEHVVRCLSEELGFRAVSVALAENGQDHLRYAASAGVPDAVKALGFRPEGTAMGVFRSGEARFVEDMAQDPNVNPGARAYFRGYACLPIQHRDRCYGVLLVNYDGAHRFDPLERQILRTFASQMAVALENARLLEASRRRAESLSALAHLGERLAERLDLDHALGVLESSLRDQLPQVDAAVFWLLEGRKRLLPRFHFGLERDPERRAAGGEGCLLAFADPQVCPFREVLGQAQGPSGDGLALVLRTPSGVEGLLLLHVTGGPGALRALDLDFLRALVDRAAHAIHHARIFESTRDAACLDSLTGLLNRGAFLERGVACLEAARKEGSPLALLMADVDHFKQCNDRYGHPFGDTVLAAVARALQAQVRPTDLAARWGGEEFVLLLPGTGIQDACCVAERIRGAMAALVLALPDGSGVPAPTLSLGVAELGPGLGELPGLIQAADAALYEAKRGGRNRCCRYGA